MKNIFLAITFNNYDLKHIDRRFGAAICIPSICKTEIIPQLMKQIFQDTNFILAEDYNQEDFCQVKTPISVNLSGGFGM